MGNGLLGTVSLNHTVFLSKPFASEAKHIVPGLPVGPYVKGWATPPALCCAIGPGPSYLASWRTMPSVESEMKYQISIKNSGIYHRNLSLIMSIIFSILHSYSQEN